MFFAFGWLKTFFFLENTMILAPKLKNPKLIPKEDFFFWSSSWSLRQLYFVWYAYVCPEFRLFSDGNPSVDRVQQSYLTFLVVFLRTDRIISSVNICSKLSLSVCRVAITLGRCVKIFPRHLRLGSSLVVYKMPLLLGMQSKCDLFNHPVQNLHLHHLRLHHHLCRY